MKFKKPKFWDLTKPNIIAYLLLPFSYLLFLINLLNKKKAIKIKNIKTICIGNIYVGGTGKTPISIEINEILKNLNFKTGFIKKKYNDQIDEQILLSKKGNLFCEKNRLECLKRALNENIEIAIFDDGLQDKNLNYDFSFICFNVNNWIGNGLLLPAGPLRENLKNIKNYDGIFLNGNGEDVSKIKNDIYKIDSNIKIFESKYTPTNLDKLDKSKNYLAFSGIGNPKSFIKTLKNNGFNVIKILSFPDHYTYSEKDIINIEKSAKELNAEIITTEKDFMRLHKKNKKNINYLEIKLQIVNEKEIIDFLKKKL